LIDSHEKEMLFANIVAENSRWLRIIAMQNARGDHWQDLEQDILLALWRSLDRYEGKSSLATWFHAVAINTAKNFKRRKQNEERPRGTMAAEPDHTHHVAASSDAVEIAEEFARSLSDLDRYVFQMLLDDLSYREMSLATGVDEANLRKRVSRIKEQFKARYDGQ
jgi:RNA polymerase sigma-70 factor (ECF subfamily)